jgi:PAS domain S-box-containing protein
MESSLQERLPLLKRSQQTFHILIHSDRYTIAGDWKVSGSDPPEYLTDLQKTAVSFNYLLSLDHENYVIHPDETPQFATLVGQLPEAVHRHFTFRIVAPDGHIKHFEGQGAVSEASITQGGSTAIEGRQRSADTGETSAETTGFEHWAFDVHRNKELLHSIFEASPLGISLLASVRNAEGAIVDFTFQLLNRTVMRQTGFSTGSKKKYSDLAPGVKLQVQLKDLITVVEENKVLHREILMERNDTALWLNLIIARFEDGILMVSEDVTQRMESEEQFQRQTVLFTKVIESSPDIIEIRNLQSGRSAYINKMLLEELKYPFAEIKRIELENQLLQLIHPDDVALYESFHRHILEAGNDDTIETELRWRAYDGNWIWLRTRARIFGRDEAGAPLKYLAFSQNVTDRKLAEEEKRKHHLLREMEKARTAFFNNVSHEFRTPLTLLLAPLQEILQQGNLPHTESQELQMAYRNALRLQKLVNTLLDFASMESGKLEAIFRPTDLSGFTADLAGNFRTIIEHAGLKFNVKCAPIGGPVYVNREMYEKIVFNLLSNAFKFTLYGTIGVKVKENKNHVKLIVSDTGTGIAKEHIPKIFERFARIEGTQARTYEGSGIGLSFVRELVRIHGATIKVSSVPGEGTEFTVIFQKGKSHLPAKSIFELKENNRGSGATVPYVEEMKGWTTDLEHREDRNNKQRHTGSDVPRLLVLVVDDNTDMRAYLKRLLWDDYDVLEAPNGKAALQLIHPDRLPDLILADVMMPETDGYTLLEAIKLNRLTMHIPVILVSAKAGEASRIEGLRYGADDYLVKPFSAKEMLARVDARIQIAHTRRKAKQALQVANAELEERIAERTRALQQANASLAEKNLEMESLNADLTSFVFMASHDLSEPLRKILTFTSMILEQESEQLSARGIDHFNKLVSATERMKILIEEVLTYSRSQHEPASMADVDLHALLEQVKADLYPLMEEKNAILSYGKLPVIHCHPVQFSQLFKNMISNSIKFCPLSRVPRITVKASLIEGRNVSHPMASQQKRYLQIVISDNGIGFDPQYREQIFLMFRRLHSITEYAGTGMGLAICKKIVEHHQGFILADSVPGAGSTFYCNFPEDMLVKG